MRDSKSSEKKPIEEVQSLRSGKPKLERFRRKFNDYNKIPAAIGAGKQEARRVGIEILGDIPWGTHICVFYQDKQDLIDILVPYFKAGLENNEFCMWITSEPLNTKEAEESLRQAVNNLSEYVEKGQIEILDYSQWYTKLGRFDTDEVLQGWNEKYEQAVKRGFDGLRVTGNALWLEKRDWKKITRYEAMANDIIGDSRILAICTYPLNKCGASEAIDVVCNHRFALIRREGRWELVESSEIRNVTKVLQKALEQWEVTFNATQDSIMLVDNDFRVLKANLATSGLLGKPLDDILGSRCYELIHGTNVAPDICPLKKMKKTKVREKVELHIPDKDIWVATSVDPILDDKGDVSSTVHIIRDITKHKQAQEALKDSEEKYRAIVERAPDGIVTVDLKGIITSCNTALLEQTGYSEQDFVGKHFSKNPTIRIKDIPKYLKIFGSLLAGKVPEPLEFVGIHKDGSEHWGEVHISIIKKRGKIIGFQAMTSDITERKQAEEKLREYQEQLKSLASELTLAEERERRRIAIELHDEISQSLFISKMKLEEIQKSGSDKTFDDTLDEISNSLGRIIADMRSLTFDLSSPILYEFGFEEAVAEWLNERVEKKCGIATEFEDDGLPKPLDDDIRVILFRNVRELLINVVKHARAKKIKVSIQKVSSRIRVSVEDDGVGFDSTKAESLITSKEAFGLFSIRERLEHLGGNLEIKSSPGCGCRVTITSPLKQEIIDKDKQK